MIREWTYGKVADKVGKLLKERASDVMVISDDAYYFYLYATDTAGEQMQLRVPKKGDREGYKIETLTPPNGWMLLNYIDVRLLIGVISVQDVEGEYLSSVKTVMCEYTNDFDKDCHGLVQDFARLVKLESPDFEWTAYQVDKNPDGGIFLRRHDITIWTNQGPDKRPYEMVGTIKFLDTYKPKID